MSKKKDLKVYMVIALDRNKVEKNSVKDLMKTLDFEFGSLSYFVKKSFKGAIETVKKTGKIRWPSKNSVYGLSRGKKRSKRP